MLGLGFVGVIIEHWLAMVVLTHAPVPPCALVAWGSLSMGLPMYLYPFSWGWVRLSLHSHVSVSSITLGENPFLFFNVVRAYWSSINEAVFMSSMLARMRLMSIGFVGWCRFWPAPYCSRVRFRFILLHLCVCCVSGGQCFRTRVVFL